MKKDIKNFKIYLLFFLPYLFSFMGCATVPPVAPPISAKIPGTYHRVEKSQTLWKFSKIYNVDLEELVKINHISDATSIEVGQMIFIPQQKKTTPSHQSIFRRRFYLAGKRKGHLYLRTNLR